MLIFTHSTLLHFKFRQETAILNWSCMILGSSYICGNIQPLRLNFHIQTEKTDRVIRKEHKEMKILRNFVVMVENIASEQVSW